MTLIAAKPHPIYLAGRWVESDDVLFTEEEIGATCCFATQDKVWVTGPGGERWEIYTVLADAETFFGTASGNLGIEAVGTGQGGCCG